MEIQLQSVVSHLDTEKVASQIDCAGARGVPAATQIYITLGADICLQAKNKILDDAKDFLSNEKWYTKRGQSTSNVYSMISYMLTRRI